MYVYITVKRYKSFSPGLTGDDVFKYCPEGYMLKCYYPSILPTKRRKITSPTLLTSLSCRLFLPASSQLRGSAALPVFQVIQKRFLHSYSHDGEAGCLRKSGEVYRAFFPFHHATKVHTQDEESTFNGGKKIALLLPERSWTPGLWLKSHHSAPKWSHTSMPGFLLLWKALINFS